MTNQENIFGELKGKIGDWQPSADCIDLDLPPDAPLPWPGLEEQDFPISPLNTSEINAPTESRDEISSEFGAILGEALQGHGTEAIAFYKSFRLRAHNPYPGKWGIFYLRQGINLLTQLISIDTSSDQADSRQLAIELLRSHEKFHYLVDVLALGIEPPLSKHLYLPLRHAYRNHGSHCVEEALANASTWQWAQKKDKIYPGILPFTENFMRHQPNAYSRFDDPPHVLNSELAANLVDQRYGKFTNVSLAAWMGKFPANISSRFIPEYVIEAKVLSRLFPRVQIFPSIKEVIDTPQVLKKLGKPGEPLKDKWEKTKKKLTVCPSLGGLDFKQWPKIQDAWSVRLDKGNRAHLKPTISASGIWETIFVGSHDEGGH